MNKLNNYLEKIQIPDESIFPMDSYDDNKKVKRNVIYGESSNINQEQERLMIDFDGVIHEYIEWNNGKLTGKLIPGTKEAIDILKKNYQIVIFTTRASVIQNGQQLRDQLVADVKDFLNKYKIHYDMITSEKLAAVAYIDDRAFRFKGNWNKIVNKIQTK